MTKNFPPTVLGLVAVKMEPDEKGDYRVVSFYKVTARELHNKRGKGHILPTVKSHT